MQIEQPLTKENFWNEMMSQFPIATKEFCEWIDEYKKAVNWNSLFKANEKTMQLHSSTYKFHDIPRAMQQGIFLEFIRQVLPSYLEQVERHMSELYDFEEDVKNVFFAMEEISQQ